MAALLLGVLGIVLVSGPAAAASPSVSVSPSSGLSDGQQVTVTGSGFTANFNPMVVVECDSTATGASGCDTNDVQFGKADANGGFTVTITVRKSFGSTDCTKVSCIIQAHEGVNASTGLTGTSPQLQFQAAATSSAPAVGTTPSSTSASSPAITTGATPTVALISPTGSSHALPTGATSGKAAPTPPFNLLIAAVAVLFALAGLGLHLRRNGARSR